MKIKSMLNFVPIQKWFNETQESNSPYIISGPCSAESPEQLDKTVAELAKLNRVHMIRAGIWKPRTRPNSFEGVGDIGLSWLVDVGRKYNLPVCTEVANTGHVEQCLKHNIDVVWIGARTVVSPFAVQEIADALKGTNIPVLIKNPINPDLKLWIGAIERLSKDGNNKIAAIHRGFSWFDKSPYRFAPRWGLPIELKSEFPSINIICDPSHIAGSRDLLLEICQKAMDLEMDGLIVESHYNPEIALSDKAQQVSPIELEEILSSIIYRTSSMRDQENELEKLRAIIDEIDEEIINKFKERFEIIRKIGEFKHDNGVTILQLDRWKEIVDTRVKMAKAEGLNEEFVKRFLKVLHEESIKMQTKILSSNRESMNS